MLFQIVCTLQQKVIEQLMGVLNYVFIPLTLRFRANRIIFDVISTCLIIYTSSVDVVFDFLMSVRRTGA